MGSYYTFSINKYEVISGKSYLEPSIGSLFVESERFEVIGAIDEESSIEYKYVSNAGKILDRLSLLGYTPKKVRKNFSEAKRRYIEQNTDDGEYWGSKELKKLTFKKWSDAIRELLRYDSMHWYQKNDKPGIIEYILDSEDDGLYFGYPAKDLFEPLVLMLSLIDSNDPVTLDYTELVHGGYYEPTDKMVELSKAIIRNQKYTNDNVILITEGKFDTFTLSESLRLLFPDHIDVFRFLDFDINSTPGGAGQLVNYMKAISGARITDRIIAIFDNDSAAHDAVRVLDQSKLERNISIMHYPKFAYLNKYPTIGPTGRKEMNVNGTSATIEMFLGDDVLDKSSFCFPVQWTGYIKSLEQYQGEVTNKGKIQELFRTKLAKAKEARIVPPSGDWSGLVLVWNAIFEICRSRSV